MKRSIMGVLLAWARRALDHGRGASYEPGRSIAGASYTTGYAAAELKKGQGARKRPLLMD